MSPRDQSRQPITLKHGRKLGFAEWSNAQEGLLAYRPWGFRLEAIRAKVYLWHGENDSSVPLAMARHLAQAIPNCQATYVAKEGHFLGLKYWTEITAQLLADQP